MYTNYVVKLQCLSIGIACQCRKIRLEMVNLGNREYKRMFKRKRGEKELDRPTWKLLFIFALAEDLFTCIDLSI